MVMSLQNFMKLTSEQQVLRELGLPYEGAQPGMVFMRTYLEDAAQRLTHCPQHDRYYTCDGRHGKLSYTDFSRICTVHAVNLIDNAPDLYLVKLHLVQPIASNGLRASSGFNFHEHEIIDRAMVRELRIDACTPEMRRLAAANPGQTIERAAMPLAPAGTLADVDFSKITASVAEKFRDSGSQPKFSWPHVLELNTLMRPKPSGP